MSWLSAIPGIATTIGGLFGKKNSGGESVSLQPQKTQGQLDVGNSLGDYFLKALQNMNYSPGASYGGPFTASATPLENTSLAALERLLAGGGSGQLLNQAGQQLSDTLSGKYANPAQSPFIQGITSLANRNLSNQLNDSRASSAARGNYFSSSALQRENDLRGDTLANLNAVIGDFTNQERNRQFQAAPIAQQLDQYQNLALPLALIESGTGYGSLNRTIQQADYERQYQDFLRQRGEQQGAISGAQGYFGTNIPYGINNFNAPVQQQNNTLGNIMSLISQLNYGGLSGSASPIQNILSLFGGR